MAILDIIVFVLFVAAVMTVGLYKSKGEETHSDHGAQDYFLAGRGLTWWLIGFSLIAANISAEQFVGMSGQGAGLYGLSVSSWEWLAAITLVVVAFALLPYFLRSGITTIPEFLEVRYNHQARFLMTVSMMLILIGPMLVIEIIFTVKNLKGYDDLLHAVPGVVIYGALNMVGTTIHFGQTAMFGYALVMLITGLTFTVLLFRNRLGLRFE